MVGGQPIEATAPDEATVVLTYAAPSGPGLRLLDMLPILPRHKLEVRAVIRHVRAGVGHGDRARRRSSEPVRSILREYHPGQRLVFDRNPRYWRKAPNGDSLPYLDRLVLELVPDQNAELLRLQSGATDLTHSELRSDDYIPVRRAEQDGKAHDGRARRRARCRRLLVLPEAGEEGARPALCLRQQARVPAGDLARGRSRGVCADGLSRRGRSDLGPDHPGQPALVLAERSALPARPRRAHARCSRASASRIATATASSKTRREPRRASR